MTLRRFCLSLALLAPWAGCDAGVIDDTEDGQVEAGLVAGDARAIKFGFDGEHDQFDYFTDFYSKDRGDPAPTLCHGYFGWNIGNQNPNQGDPSDPASRAHFEQWIAAAKGVCDEALISFKAHTHGLPPTEAEYEKAFHNFVTTNWGFGGHFDFTPWNEPNNPADDGNGLGAQIDPRLAARYYLAAEKECRAHGCTVAAGDFASNGTMWNSFEINCADDNVLPANLCKHKSKWNKTNKSASYLDRYKNEIANKATDFNLGAGFRPAYFAYHGWHDTNEYINKASHCGTYDDCALRRILQSLSSSWGSVIIWDSEDGIGQNVPISDHEQACGAAFLLRLATISQRVHRVYITRLHSGGGRLLNGHIARPAMTVLADRERTYEANCK